MNAGLLALQTNKGTFVKPSDITVSEYLDEYLIGATRGRRESTKVSYREAFRPVRERLGNRKLQSVTKADIESLVGWMLTSGRKRGGTPGTGLDPRSVRLTLGRLKAAFEMAVDEDRLVRNVVKLVTPPESKPKERDIWSRAEVRKFLADRRTDQASRGLAAEPVRPAPRRGARPALAGHRPEGQDLDRQPGAGTRRLQVRIEEPKSDNGKRTLPLDDDLVAALVELRKRQAHESEAAGPTYGAGLADLDWYTEGDKYVVTDKLGTRFPRSPTPTSSRACSSARACPRSRLHDSRHTTLSLMEKAGVPISIISKWAGHYDSSFTMKTYVHASDDDLK